MVVYENQFDANEWYVIVSILVMYGLLFLLPKRFSLATSVTFVVLGIYIGMVSDHTLSIPPLDFYDVNDNSSYQLIDFLTYVMYGPYAYLFLYIYDRFKIMKFKIMLYVIVWTIISVIFEYFAMKLAVFHYKNGYEIIFSIPIYLFIQSFTILYFHIFKTKSSSIRL
jgi:hypothetical protein